MKLFLFSFFLLGNVYALEISGVEQINLKCENGFYFDFEKSNSMEVKNNHGTLNGLNVAKNYTANIEINNEITVEVLTKGRVMMEFKPAFQKTECLHEPCISDDHQVRSYRFEFSVNKNTTTCYLYLFE